MILAHLDLDAFYAAVEELENPELRSKPLIVGGDPRGRGVVATANYVARGFGIHSAMSAAEAIRRCPEAVFVRPRHSLYREYSRHVWSTVRGIVPTLEQTGIDEGYLDLGDIASGFLEARVVAEAVQTAVRAGTSLTCSIGVAPCKVVAKIGSDARKPGGLTVVVPGQEATFLAPFDVRRLPGVGPKAEQRLLSGGVQTIGALAAIEDDATSAGCSPAASARCCATARAASTHAAWSSASSASPSPWRTHSTATSSTANGCTTSCAGWRARSRAICARAARRRVP